ncbi:MAG TPA: MFS transporter [Candidatus Limnocylindria bacterium]|nr:MFS transporter [Candidatus Limnocylindria bacterium]
MSEAPPHRFLSPAILGIAAGMMLVPLNSTMLAVALPSVLEEFDVSAGTVATLVTVYLGAMVLALPPAGALGDRLGHRRTFLAGVAGFAAASLLAAVAGAFWVLILARVLQAASGSLISTSAAALVRAAAPENQRGAAFGTFDMLVTVSAAVGPFVGGVIVGALDWRWMFLLAVPVGAFAALSVLAWHPPGTDAAQPRPGRFVPINLRLFTRREFSAAVAGILGATVILHGSFILVPLMVEQLMGATATTAGLVLLGISGVSAVAAPLGGRASDRIGRRAPVMLGSLVTAVGLGLLAWYVVAVPLSLASAIPLALLLGVVGAGFGLAGSARQAAALEAVPAHEVGVAAATYYTGRYLGGVIGASLAGAVLTDAVVPGSVSLGFVILAVVAAAVALVSAGLPGPREVPATPA